MQQRPYPFRTEFCAPAKDWEKGLVETGVPIFMPASVHSHESSSYSTVTHPLRSKSMSRCTAPSRLTAAGSIGTAA